MGAERANEEGNAAFKNGEYVAAVAAYSRGIELAEGALVKGGGRLADDATAILVGNDGAPEIGVLANLLGNRAAALLKVEEFENSLADSERALKLRPMWTKAYHRKAQALLGLGQLERARDAYSTALDGDPDNAFMKKQADLLDEKTGRLSAHDKINKYVEEHGTILGCPTKLSLSMFDVESVLGEGNYSTVFKAVFKATGELFAIKSVDKGKADRMSKRHPNLFNELKMEKKLLLRLNHPNVVRLHHTMQDVTSLYFVQELAPGGELWARMCFGKESLVALRPSLARFYCAQLVNALDCLRRNGIVHRDIKPENMMLFPVPGTGGRVEFMKLIDFGTAYDMHDTALNGPKFVGTPEYMSPEAIAAKADPTPTLDVWALGSTLFQLTTGRLPFKGSSPYLTFLKTKALNYHIPPYVTGPQRDLFQRMFVEDPAKRLGAGEDSTELRTHPYFASIDFARLQTEPIVPVPSLLQLALEAAVDVFVAGGTKPVSASGKKAGLPKWATEAGTFSEAAVRPRGAQRVRDLLMGMLGQRLLLGVPWIFRLFYPSDTEARFQRTAAKTFVGHSETEQGKFTDPFVVVHLGSLQGASEEVLETTMRRLNRLEPQPRLLVLSGKLGDDIASTQRGLSALSSSVPVACCHDGSPDYETHFGEPYYSMYVGGVLVIVVNSFQLAMLPVRSKDEGKDKDKVTSGGDHSDDEALTTGTEEEQAAERQAKWLDGEILQGKLCARHVILVSHHVWALDPAAREGDPKNVLPAHVAERFFDNLQDAGAQVVLSGADASRASMERRKPKSDMHSRLQLINTARHVPLQPGASPQLRVVRVQPSDVVTDKYTVATLPRFFALDRDVELDAEQGQQEKQGFSDISSSSSEDEDED